MIEYSALEDFLEEIKDALPHGSGINGTWSIVRYRSGIVWFGCSYDYMTDTGFYDGGFDFQVSYSYDTEARTAKFRRLWTDIDTFMVSGECGNCGGTHMKKCTECDFGYVYDDDDMPIDCSECNGTGDTVCPECDEEGNVTYDDLPSLLEYLDQCFWEEIKL